MSTKREYDLVEILELMTKHKATKVKLGSLEVELSPQAFAAPELQLPADPLMSSPMPSDAEMLEWSTGEVQ